MADNVTLQSAAPATPPAGTILASRSAAYSGDGTQIGVVGLVKFSGADDAKLATDIDPATETKQDLMVTALQLLDNAVSGSGYNISQMAGVAPAMGSGVITAGVQRVVLPTDHPNVPINVAAVSVAAATPVRIGSLTNSAQTVIGSSKVLDSLFIFNPSGATAYVQIYDTAGAVTVGTTTPTWSIGIKAGESVWMTDLNLNFANAIKVAATTTATGGSAPGTALEANFSYRS